MSTSTITKINSATPMFAIFDDVEETPAERAVKTQTRFMNSSANGFGSIGRKDDPNYINFVQTPEEFRDFC